MDHRGLLEDMDNRREGLMVSAEKSEARVAARNIRGVRFSISLYFWYSMIVR